MSADIGAASLTLYHGLFIIFSLFILMPFFGQRGAFFDKEEVDGSDNSDNKQYF